LFGGGGGATAGRPPRGEDFLSLKPIMSVGAQHYCFIVKMILGNPHITAFGMCRQEEKKN
jgi:hypothetical protein